MPHSIWTLKVTPVISGHSFKIIDKERILIETDSPFLSPEPNRGKKNEPSFIKYTAEKLALIRNVQVSEIMDHTSKNFNNLFNFRLWSLSY